VWLVTNASGFQFFVQKRADSEQSFAAASIHPTSIMPEFDAFRVKAQAALRQCLTETQAHRVKTGVQDIPPSVLLSLIEQHMVPLTGPDNGANVQLSPEPKYDWRKNALELIYRQELYDIVVRARFTRHEMTTIRLFTDSKSRSPTANPTISFSSNYTIA
jgi:hypothetical protein